MPQSIFLYYITDRTQFLGDESARRRALLAKIAEATEAGVSYIQLREKDLSARELEGLARDAVRAIGEAQGTENRKLRTGLLINSRTDIALAVGADGVHLRADDLSVAEVRSAWMNVLARSSRPGARSPVICCSCHTQPDVIRAQSEGADFAVFAPVFEKRDRPDTRPAGLDLLREASKAGMPVLALGGVKLENAASCLEAGAAGIAGIRLFQENKIQDVVRALEIGR